jgi:hypothetical protein
VLSSALLIEVKGNGMIRNNEAHETPYAVIHAPKLIIIIRPASWIVKYEIPSDILGLNLKCEPCHPSINRMTV